MAIPHIVENDALARAKMNAAIDQANLVAGKVGRDALLQEAAARDEQARELQTAVKELQDAVAQETLARAAGDRPRALYSELGPMRGRPGEPGRFFTSTLDGEPSAVTPIADEIKMVTADGRVAQLAGAGRIAPIAVLRIEPGHQYRARFVFRRSVDSEDPAGDAVQMGLRWLTVSLRRGPRADGERVW